MNLMNESNDSNWWQKKWNNVDDQSNASYNVGNEVIYNTEVLKSIHCDYDDA